MSFYRSNKPFSNSHVQREKTNSFNDDNEFESPSSSPPRDSTIISRKKTYASTVSNHHSLEHPTTVAVEEIKTSVISVPSKSTASNENGVMSSSLPPSENRIESADTAVKEIENDKLEAQRMIVTYGIDPVEILHVVERWTQTLLREFHSSCSHFKHTLKRKWEKQELNINSDFYNRERILYNHVKQLEKSTETCLSKKHFEELKLYLTKIDHNTNVGELKSKINDIIETFLKLIESVEFIEQYHENGNGSSFETIKNVLQKLRYLNTKESHTICIIGLEKCGKSTYINALLGFKLLPAESERCTQIRTVLKPPLQDNPSLFAMVEFYSDDQFKILIEKMVKKNDEEEQQYQLRKTQVLEKHRKLLNSFPQGKQMLTLHSNGTNVDNQRADIIKQLHNYITDELCVNIIREISIYTKELPGKNYELLDVPGFDSPIKEHRDAGLEAIKSADAFLFLTDGGRPSLTRDQIRLLNEIQDGRQHYEAMKRAFGIITKLDHCHTKDGFNERYIKARHELINKRFKENHIFAVCSITNLLEQDSNEYQTIVNKIKDFNDLQNGFQQSKEALNQFIELELPKTHLSQLIDLGLTKLSHYVNESVSKAKKLLPLNVSFTDEGSFDEYIKQENDQKWDKIYNDELFQPTFDNANIWQKKVLVQERDKFIQETKEIFHDGFTNRTKEFINRPIDIRSFMMKQYDYTALHSTSQPIDNQLRRDLSFELEEAVLQTINTLARYLYDEYVSNLQKILNEISREENDDVYRTQQLSYDICRYEIRAVVLRTCRPIITATLRFSHSDQLARRAAINELILLAPTLVCHLCENNNSQSESYTQKMTNWAPTLKKGVEFALGIYGKTGTQNKIAANILKMIIDRVL